MVSSTAVRAGPPIAAPAHAPDLKQPRWARASAGPDRSRSIKLTKCVCAHPEACSWLPARGARRGQPGAIAQVIGAAALHSQAGLLRAAQLGRRATSQLALLVLLAPAGRGCQRAGLRRLRPAQAGGGARAGRAATWRSAPQSRARTHATIGQATCTRLARSSTALRFEHASRRAVPASARVVSARRSIISPRRRAKGAKISIKASSSPRCGLQWPSGLCAPRGGRVPRNLRPVPLLPALHGAACASDRMCIPYKLEIQHMELRQLASGAYRRAAWRRQHDTARATSTRRAAPSPGPRPPPPALTQPRRAPNHPLLGQHGYAPAAQPG